VSEDVHHDYDVSHEDYMSQLRLARRDFLVKSGLAAAAAAAATTWLTTEQAAAAIKASTGRGAAADPIASGAVNAAKQFKGITLRRINEAGPQALDDKNFSGPLWEKLTGIKATVAEAPFAQIRTKVIAEHLAKSGALDTIEMSPAWLPDFADQGVIVPIDDYIRKYRAQSTVADLHPLYRALGRYKGKTWGFFDDGDVWALYYRKDIFNNAKLKSAYKAKFKRDLRVPRGWDEFNQVAQFITDQLAPTTYGTGMGRALGNPGNQFYFFQQFRANGGRFFNPQTMKAEIANAIGIKTMNQILAQNKASPPGVDKLDFVSGWGLWLQGKTAMIMAWPPTGRISENYSQRDKAFSFLPKSKIVGKVGYAKVPGANGEHAGSFIKAVMATSENKDASYLFNQWANSPSVSLQRVMLPYTLRDPYRISHYKSPKYRSLWPAAAEYLRTLSEAANDAVLDLTMSGAGDYANAIDRAMTGIYAGKDVKDGLEEAAAEWDRITNKLGVAKQRASYANFLTYPGSTGKNTVRKRGQAVKI
jgi:multiple sugar transport system substrate-binding protein